MKRLVLIALMILSIVSCSKDDEDILERSITTDSEVIQGVYVATPEGLQNNTYTLTIRQNDFDLLVTVKSVWSDNQLLENKIDNIDI